VGYAGGNDINYAMERGEVDGRCGWAWSSIKTTRPDWVKDGTVRVLLQFGLIKHPELPDVPLVMDLARSEEERQVMKLVMMSADFGRPFLAPPGIPPQRAAVLRTAFEKTLADPKFQADAKLLRAEITPVAGAALEQLLKEAYATAADIVDRTRAMIR
jgi:tripartite-type tricarboxylate transporter receptor subunit TctC